MGTFALTLSNAEWTKITVKGSSGTCWKKTGGPVVVCHTDQENSSTLPLSNTNVTIGKSKRCPLDRDSNEVLVLDALSEDSVYYALSLVDETAKIVIDSLKRIVVVFNVIFEKGETPFDKISGNLLTTTHDAGVVDSENPGGVAQDIPTITANGLESVGDFDQLIAKSEDLTNGVWTKDTGVVVTPTTFLANLINDFMVQNISTTEGLLYTISFKAKVASGGHTEDYTYLHSGSVTGNQTDLTLSETLEPYSITVLGRSGGGNIGFGFRDINASDWALVTITDWQVTQTSYPYPYATNNTTGVLSIANNAGSATEGTKAVGMAANFPGLFDSLDGVADGVDVVVNGDFATDTVWNKLTGVTISGGEAIFSGSTAFEFSLSQASILTIGKMYEVTYTITEYTSGEIRSRLGTNLGVTRVAIGTYTDRLEAQAVNLAFQTVAVSFTGKIDNVSVKQISPAQGQMEYKGKFFFNAADISGTINLLTGDDDADSFFRYNVDSEQFEAYDGTNTAVVSHTAVKDADFVVLLDYGDDSGQKMRLTADAVVGSQATNAGSFPTASYDMTWNYENPEYVSCESVKFKEEPEW